MSSRRSARTRVARLLGAAALVATTLGALPASPAFAHPAFAHRDERPVVMPDGKGSVPAYRSTGPTLLVCKTEKAVFDKAIASFPTELRSINLALWTQCQKAGHRSLTEALAAAKQPGLTIKILPGTYLEEPSLQAPSQACAGVGAEDLSYEQQQACPANGNLVAILGKRNLQVEGTGATPADVVLDARFKKEIALRADRANGLYLRNFTVQQTTGTAVHVMETDGFVIDAVVARWNDEHGVVTLADDHGLLTDCETYGNGSAGVETSSSQNVKASGEDDAARWAIEVRRCRSHHNLVGLAGTATDSVWVHDNQFTNNTAGVALDSARPGYPGVPQNHARFERNAIGSNNQDYYRHVRAGTCDKPSPLRGYDGGVVCPTSGVVRGVGVLSLGGSDNVWADNWVYDNATAGFLSGWAPGLLRDDNRFKAQFDTSHHNEYVGNNLGIKPDGGSAANGLDFWWDGQGVGSCWQRPSAPSLPAVLPRCTVEGGPAGLGTARYLPEPAMALKLLACSGYDEETGTFPSDCEWFGATGFGRIEVRFALGQAVLFGLLALLLWARLLRGRGGQVALLGLVLTLGGLGAGVHGALHETTLWTPIGLGLVGLGMLCLGAPMRRRGRPGLGIVTMAIGAFALLGGIDRGLWMLPLIPFPPSVPRILLELAWVPWALVAIIGGRVLAGTDDEPPPRRRRRKADPLVRFAATLRG